MTPMTPPGRRRHALGRVADRLPGGALGEALAVGRDHDRDVDVGGIARSRGGAWGGSSCRRGEEIVAADDGVPSPRRRSRRRAGRRRRRHHDGGRNRRPTSTTSSSNRPASPSSNTTRAPRGRRRRIAGGRRIGRSGEASRHVPGRLSPCPRRRAARSRRERSPRASSRTDR